MDQLLQDRLLAMARPSLSTGNTVSSKGAVPTGRRSNLGGEVSSLSSLAGRGLGGAGGGTGVWHPPPAFREPLPSACPALPGRCLRAQEGLRPRERLDLPPKKSHTPHS